MIPLVIVEGVGAVVLGYNIPKLSWVQVDQVVQVCESQVGPLNLVNQVQSEGEPKL